MGNIVQAYRSRIKAKELCDCFQLRVVKVKKYRYVIVLSDHVLDYYTVNDIMQLRDRLNEEQLFNYLKKQVFRVETYIKGEEYSFYSENDATKAMYNFALWIDKMHRTVKILRKLRRNYFFTL